LIVEIKDRTDRDQIHVRLIVTVDSTNIAPVFDRATIAIAEGKGTHALTTAHHTRNDILTKIMTFILPRIGQKLTDKGLSVEDVDPH